ncbi:MAG: response regulator [Prolixibacteraceae bacterium]|jgi:CheY-like chemotaxis protein/HPt (histidine-containing phosphotransfer) domain-containing protein
MPLKISSDDQPEIPYFFRNLHFLIADDEEFNLFVIKNILNKWRVSFEEAHDGKETVELALKQSFDLILLDLRMPRMDGYEAAKIIMENRPESKIIALTGSIKPENTKNENRNSILLYLQKPFTEFSLFNAINKILHTTPEEKSYNPVEKNPPVDLEELMQMTGGDKAFFDEMLKIFIRASENGLAKIHHSFNISDWIGIGEAAHKLAAPSKHLHAIKLYANLKILENEATESKDMEKTQRLIQEIEQEIIEINTYLTQKLSD